jgi:hypothetical protein
MSTETFDQAVIWTALPQGFVPGTEEKQARVSVFVTPQLSVTGGSGGSPHLSTYTDWVNWPKTMKSSPSGPIKFKLIVTNPVGPEGATLTAEPDLSVLRPDLWAAMFPADETRVDPYAIENFNEAKINSFQAATVHQYIEGLYGPLNAGESVPPLLFEPFVGKAKAGEVRPDFYESHGLPGLPKPVESPGNVQNLTWESIAARPPQFYDTLKFHEVPEDERVKPPTEAPVIDFHSAVSSLSAYPELLVYFGLVFTLTIDVDDLPANPNAFPDFELSVEPEWKSSFGANSINVKPKTVAILETFLPQPYGSDYNNDSLSDGAGFLLLGKSNEGTPQFSVLDVDIDGAAESLRSAVSGIESTLKTHSGSRVSLDLRLPSLRSAGPSILWHGWGDESREIEEGKSLNLAALAAMQTKFQEEVKAFIEKKQPDPPLVYAEHLTRGWRIDIGQFIFGQEGGFDNQGGRFKWDSLHWRLGSYVFGTGAGAQKLLEPGPIEGFVSPGATHQPVAKGQSPEQLWIHESIARWDGWSLSTPRPGRHIKNKGEISTKAEEEAPNPAATHTIEGNKNPQISASFSIPEAGTVVATKETFEEKEENVGETGLPPLRFGTPYSYRARSVDLSGWSLPQNSDVPEAGLISAIHYRWEPVRPPFVIPAAPLGVGEGSLTIVLRDDGTGAHVQPNARWLFPPKVHELMAEEHGAFDEEGVPSVKAEALINKYNDGSLASLPGITIDEGSAGVQNIILPHAPNASVPSIPAAWLVDPPAAGLAIAGTGAPQHSMARGYQSLPGQPPLFVDLWSGEWPALIGKLLRVQAAEEPYEGYDSRDKKNFTDHWPWLAEPVWSFTPAETESAEVLTMSVVPGSVYTLEISSAFAAPEDAAELGDLALFGMWPWIEKVTQKPFLGGGPPIAPPNPIEAKIRARAGAQYQLTPAQTITVIYAVLIPQRAARFSEDREFKREPNSTAMTIEDLHYIVDTPSTSTITYEATWTDPVDNPSEPEDWTASPSEPEDNGKVPRAFAQEPKTFSQSGLLVHAETLYPPTVPPGPLEVTPPEGESPFGLVSFEGPFDEIGPHFYAEQRFGDTKHHLVTYTATAGSRFGEFFATTVMMKLGTTATTIDARGISANNLKIVVPEVPADKSPKNVALPAVTVPASLYRVDPTGGMITLVPDAKVTQAPAGEPPAGGEIVELEKVELAVTYVPTDTLVGPPQEYHVLSSATPPPVKIVKVAPAWSISRQGSIDEYGGLLYQRAGNTLRVYFERPWYATGADEFLGVVVAHNAPGPTLPSNIRADLVTTLGFDPISVPSHDSEYASQSQLIFLTNTKIPATETTPERDKATVTLLEETGSNLYDVWPYKPQYDPESGLWFADVMLANNFQGDPSALPPGYFLRLSVVRYQPFSAYSQVSPVALVTYAQPVPDRLVEVRGEEPVHVSVRGSAYSGWRAAGVGEEEVLDRENPNAEHPNSTTGTGSRATSTMIVEVQEQNDENGFSGDLAWSTVEGHITKLTPEFDAGEAEWSTPDGITLPKTSKPLRLRISELDYYDGAAPEKVDTSQRRPFVCLIPFPRSRILKVFPKELTKSKRR